MFAEYQNYDAIGLVELIASGQVSADEVLEAAIARAQEVNGKLNAIVHPMYDEAHRTVAAGLPQGPLSGVPFLLKDLHLAYKGAPTSNGSKMFDGFVPDYDNTLTARQRAAGLVIMGKTNTPELGICGSTEPTRFGPTRNPWNLDHSSGGSSGGSAAAVAAGITPLAHATDGGGSIRIPAANCGLFGLKPSRGRTPYGPLLGESLNGLSVGHCVSRSVRDSALLLDATQGPAPGDPYAAPPPARPYIDEVGADTGSLRIALMTTAFDGKPLHPECVKAAEDAGRLCEQLGHHVEPAMPDIDDALVRSVWRILAGANLWDGLVNRAAALGREPQPDDVEPITWLWALEGKERKAPEFAGALRMMHGLSRKLGEFFERYDVLLSPTMAKPPLPLGVMVGTGDDLEHYIERLLLDEIPMTPLANETGCPAMSVPLGWSEDGLPIGVHFGARYGDEATLFRLAAQLEQAAPWSAEHPDL